MEDKVKKAVACYQCAGCLLGHKTTCYRKNRYLGVGCEKHIPSVSIPNVGSIFLGMPKGFDQLGHDKKMKIIIFESFEKKGRFKYNMLNVPVWKFLDENGNTIVKGLSPRVNRPFLHIFLGDCRDRISCQEIKSNQVEIMASL